jgi:hypothetical protein
MNWEAATDMTLVLMLAVEAILTLWPMAEPASAQPDEGGLIKEGR